jgi:Zn-dependent metalloprotease
MIQLKLKVLVIALTTLVLLSSSYVYSQTSKVTDKFGNELRVESNPVTNSVKRIYRVKAPTTRHGVSVGQISKSNIEQLGKSIIKDYEDILDISSNDLKVYRAKRGRNSSWHLGFQQLYKDVPVWGSFVRYTIEGQGVVNTISADIHPDIKLSIAPTISADNAISTAIKAFKEDDSDTIVVKEKPGLYIYPRMVEDSVSYYLTYKIGLSKESPFKEYIYFISAVNGEIVHNESVFINASNNNGNVEVAYFPEHHYDNSVSFSDLSGVTVQIKNTLGQTIASTTTTSSGYYNLNWNAAYAAYYLWGHHNLDLANSYCRIIDDETVLGTHAYGYFTPGSTIEHDWSWASEETNVYYHVNLIHDYITDDPFYFDDMDYQCDATVNIEDWDNASSDGTDLRFGDYRAYAKSSDIIYHEYTHCIIHHLYDGWIGFPYTYTHGYAMDEGFADYFGYYCNNG